MRGSFIAFEGCDHCGKSLQIELLKKYFQDLKRKDIIYTREPGGYNIPVCEKIRSILLDPQNEICKETEAYLYAAGRAQHVDFIIKSMNQNMTVISDRYYHSSLIYQGIVRGLGYRTVQDLNKLALKGLKPDIVFYLKIDLDTYKERKSKQTSLDRLESEDIQFFEKIINGYDTIFSDREIVNESKVITLDGRKSPDEIHEEIIYHIERI